MGFDLHDAIIIGTQIEAALKDYAANIDKYGVRVLPEARWQTSAAAIRASNFSPDKCPKLVAADKRLHLKQYDEKTLWKFALAHYAAGLAKFAIKQHFEQLSKNAFATTGESWSVRTEAPVGYEHIMSGTIDVLIRIVSKSVSIEIPIEIKRTDADKYSGVADYAVWQTIAYMWMLDAEYGYTVTLYSGIDNAYRAWVIQRVDNGWLLHKSLSEQVLFSDDLFGQIYTDLLEWNDKGKVLDDLTTDGEKKIVEFMALPAPYQNHLGFPCVRKIKPPELYVRDGKYGKKGDIKPGTGIATEPCPLYAYCHKEALDEADISRVGDSLDIEEVDGIIRLRRK